MEEMRTFGYLCPKCGKPVRKSRSIFALEASNAEVECDCGGSALRVSFDGEKYRLTVPCGLCGGTHEAVCRPEQLTEGPGLALACAGSKQFSCFIGPEETVRRHLEELELLAAKEKLQEGEETPEAFADNVLMYEVLSELKDIASRPQGITCGCGPGPGRPLLPLEAPHPRNESLRRAIPAAVRRRDGCKGEVLFHH